MGYSIAIGAEGWDELRSHLLSDNNEHLAFLLANLAGDRLLVRDVILVPDYDIEYEGSLDGLTLKLDALLAIVNRANSERQILIEAHSHPFSRRTVEFSSTDLVGQDDLAAYLSDIWADRAYSALVLGQDSLKGRFWPPCEAHPVNLAEVRVVGSSIERIPADGLKPTGADHASRLYNRQILALGQEGQRNLQGTRVAIVGLGGIGTLVAQQMAHLGVGGFILIDRDVIDETNLHRLPGASLADGGRPKVEFASSLISKVNPDAKITAINHSVRHLEPLLSIKSADVILGCVDSDAGRLILNEFALAYLTPYIDCGVGITADKGQISEAGGRVVVWVPGRPCLLCCKEFRHEVAAEELESEQERVFRIRNGYVSGEVITEPAVMSLNGTVASLAVTEFLALVTGFRASGHYCYYDMLAQRVGPRIVRMNQKCVACATEGLGESANIERYSKIGLPRDLPT